MTTPLKDANTIDSQSFPYIFEQNVTVELANNLGHCRLNIYRPKDSVQHPVLASCGPYGKDVPYSRFNPASWAEVNPEHKSTHSAWELPDPTFWTAHGYVVVRADEPGFGQSPGYADLWAC